MKNTKRIIICAAAAVVLGVGVTAAAAAQTAGVSEPIADDTASEISSSEIFDTEISEPEKPSEETVSENESVSADEEEKMTSSEEWVNRQHVPPLANVPDDFDYSGFREIIPTEIGSEVYAVDDGVVCYADSSHFNGGFGGVIAIMHADNAYTLYGNLEMGEDYEVGVGDTVKAGQFIARSDMSGHTDIPALWYCFQDTEPVFYHPGDDIDYNDLPIVEPVENDYIIPVEGGFISGRYN